MFYCSMLIYISYVLMLIFPSTILYLYGDNYFIGVYLEAAFNSKICE